MGGDGALTAVSIRLSSADLLLEKKDLLIGDTRLVVEGKDPGCQSQAGAAVVFLLIW